MSVKPGDKIRITRKGLQSAGVDVGDVLAVEFFVDEHSIQARAEGAPSSWWFSVACEGDGFEKVQE